MNQGSTNSATFNEQRNQWSTNQVNKQIKLNQHRNLSVESRSRTLQWHSMNEWINDQPIKQMNQWPTNQINLQIISINNYRNLCQLGQSNSQSVSTSHLKTCHFAWGASHSSNDNTLLFERWGWGGGGKEKKAFFIPVFLAESRRIHQTASGFSKKGGGEGKLTCTAAWGQTRRQRTPHLSSPSSAAAFSATRTHTPGVANRKQKKTHAFNVK